MSELPTEYQAFYVYTHNDPFTGEVKYVGKGKGDRAWVCRPKQSGGRDAIHLEYLEEMFTHGFTMADIVNIFAKNLTQEDAFQIEMELINQNRPVFNKNFNSPHCILSQKDLEVIKSLREVNVSYKNIAEELNVSTMTVYRAYNNQTKGYTND